MYFLAILVFIAPIFSSLFRQIPPILQKKNPLSSKEEFASTGLSQ